MIPKELRIPKDLLEIPEIERVRQVALTLAEEWERIAHKRLNKDEHKIDFGAVCYFNAACDIREAFELPCLPPVDNPVFAWVVMDTAERD